MNPKDKWDLLQYIPINTNRIGQTLASLVGNKCPFYIPLFRSSLYSEFCKGVKWIDLIGNPTEIPEAIDVDGIKLVPIYINPRFGKDNILRLHTTLVINPSVKRVISVPYDKVMINEEAVQPPNSRFSASRPKRFIFNDIDFDIVKLTHEIPYMNKEKLYGLKIKLVKSLYLLLRVDFIVTDTNTWCTMSDDKKTLKYAKVLERIANYIINNKLPTKFLVLSEILTELKRLSKKNIMAREAQRLLINNFVPRKLIFIPNPTDDIPQDVYADPCIQKYVLKLYKEGKRISVVSNDQQAMMLFNAAVTNEKVTGNTFPNFLSIENINQLFILLNKIPL